MNADIAAAAAIATSKLNISYGTTLPASPADKDIAILVDSTTNPSYQWMFRYNAGSSSSFKWEFIGGSPAYSEVLALETTTSSTYTDLATVGPSFTIPRSGDYIYVMRFQGYNNTANAYAIAGVKLGAAATNDDNSAVLTSATAGAQMSPMVTRKITGASASDLWKVQYMALGGGTANFLRRVLEVIPVRVS